MCVFLHCRLICEPLLISNSRYTVKEADAAYQPKVDLNSLKFEGINDDCLLKIASFLDVIDIINLGKTSTRLQSFAQLIYQREPHFSYRTDTGDSSITERNVQSVLQEMGNYIQSIEWHNLQSNHLDYIIANCPNVIDLNLQNPSHVLNLHLHLHVVQQFFAHLETLTLCDSSVFDGAIKAIISTRLTSLKLENCRNIGGRFLANNRRLSSLQELQIRNCRKVDSDAVYNFVESGRLVKFAYDRMSLQKFLELRPECLSHLEELELSSSYSVNTEQLHFRHVPRLTHLALKFYGKFFYYAENCNNFLPAISQIRTLQSLKIIGMQANGDTLKSLGLLRNLQYLCLDHFDNGVGGKFFQSLHLHLPGLTKLEISHIPSNRIIVQPQFICNMISSLQFLKHFSFDYVSQDLINMILKSQQKQNSKRPRPTIEIGIPSNWVTNEMVSF